MSRVISLLIEWLSEPEHLELRRAFTMWIQRVLRQRVPGAEIPEMQDLQEIRSIVDQQEDTWTYQWEQAGRRVGRQEGRQEGEARLLVRLLERQFGPLGDAVRKTIEGASSDTLLEWGDRVLTARRLEDVIRA